MSTPRPICDRSLSSTQPDSQLLAITIYTTPCSSHLLHVVHSSVSRYAASLTNAHELLPKQSLQLRSHYSSHVVLHKTPK